MYRIVRFEDLNFNGFFKASSNSCRDFKKYRSPPDNERYYDNAEKPANKYFSENVRGLTVAGTSTSRTTLSEAVSRRAGGGEGRGGPPPAAGERWTKGEMKQLDGRVCI